MKRAAIAFFAVALAACSRQPSGEAPASAGTAEAPQAEAASPIVPVSTQAPAGRYALDKSHASLVFSVDHIGYSQYTGGFDNFDATLDFDPANPEAMRVEATIDVHSLDIPAPPAGFLDELKSAAWLDAVGHPAMKFRSTKVTMTASDAARIDGDLTFRGVTAPVVMEARFNGGYANFPPYDQNARIGFSATGALKRSLFGVDLAIPNEEQPFGVGDLVAFEIEAEFTGPPTPFTEDK